MLRFGFLTPLLAVLRAHPDPAIISWDALTSDPDRSRQAVQRAFVDDDAYGIILVKGVPGLGKLRRAVLEDCAEAWVSPGQGEHWASSVRVAGAWPGWRPKASPSTEEVALQGGFALNPFEDSTLGATVPAVDPFMGPNRWHSQEFRAKVVALNKQKMRVTKAILQRCDEFIGDRFGHGWPNLGDLAAQSSFAYGGFKVYTSKQQKEIVNEQFDNSCQLSQQSCLSEAASATTKGMSVPWHMDHNLFSTFTPEAFYNTSTGKLLGDLGWKAKQGDGLVMVNKEGEIVPLIGYFDSDTMALQMGVAGSMVTGGFFRAGIHGVVRPGAPAGAGRVNFLTFWYGNPHHINRLPPSVSQEEFLVKMLDGWNSSWQEWLGDGYDCDIIAHKFKNCFNKTVGHTFSRFRDHYEQFPEGDELQPFTIVGYTGIRTHLAQARMRTTVSLSTAAFRDWTGPITWPYSPDHLPSSDCAPGSDKPPAFMTDSSALSSLSEVYHSIMSSKPASAGPLAVLDTSGFRFSYLPSDLIHGGRVAVHGPYQSELDANKQATETTIGDQNCDPQLPYANSSFHFIINLEGAPYLSQPREAITEMHRVLKPGGLVIFVFTNGYDEGRATPLWLQEAQVSDHSLVIIVETYLWWSPRFGFSNISAADIGLEGSSLYIVVANKI